MWPSPSFCRICDRECKGNDGLVQADVMDMQKLKVEVEEVKAKVKASII